MKNIKEARELIQRYREITLEEIKECWNVFTHKPAFYTARSLTGFGTWAACTLCRAVSVKCTDCIYVFEIGCGKNGNKPTYQAIEQAKSPEALLTAFRNRADHIEKLIEGK